MLSPELTPAAIVTAMEQGRFYASCGVKLDRIASSTGGLEVSVVPEQGVTYTIEFIGTRQGFDPASKPVVGADGKEVRATRIYSESVGEVLKTVEGTKGRYEFTGNELYVRARVTSSKPHPNPSEVGDVERAWVQPTRGPGAPPIVR